MVQRQGSLTGGWGTTGKLRAGGQRFGGPPGLVFEADFSGEDEYGVDPRGRPASVYTVQFDVDPDAISIAAAAGSQPFRHLNPVATVQFSTCGVSIRRRLSLVNGTSISGVCDHVSVRVQDFTNDTGEIPPAATFEYSVSILVTPGSRAARHVPPILMDTVAPVFAVLGGATADIPIPDDAGVSSVCIYATSTGGGLAEVALIDWAGALLARWVPLSPIFVPVTPKASRLRMLNSGPALSQCTFAVVYGIDG